MEISPTKYWIFVQTNARMPKGLKNGLHVVEAIVGKAEVRLRRNGAASPRFKVIPRWRWDQMAKTEWSPEISIAQAAAKLRKGTAK